MEICINHPSVGRSSLRTRIVGVAEWKQIMDEELPTASISTPESAGIEHNQHLVRGTVMWSKRGCKESNLERNDILQIGTRAEQVIVIDSDCDGRAKQITACRSTMNSEPSNLTIIPQESQRNLDDLTSLPIVRSHAEGSDGNDSSFATEPTSTFQIENTYNPAVVEFVQNVVEEIVTDRVVDGYNDKQLEHLKILYIKDKIKSGLSCKQAEYIHQNAREIVEVVDVDTIPTEVVNQDDINISTPTRVIGVKQANYCLSAHIAGIIEGRNDLCSSEG